MFQKYAFLDRDGALIYEPREFNPDNPNDKTWVPYQIDSIEKLKILDGVIEGLQFLKELGYKFVMVTNQNGIGSEIFPEKAFWEPQNRMIEIFKDNGIEFEDVFICPHFSEENCDCRKPKTALLDNFFENNDIDLERSFMYGDRESDALFAKNLEIPFVKTETNGGFNIDDINNFIN